MKTSHSSVPEVAQPLDFLPILELYRKASGHLNAQGIVQWDDEYPSPDTLKENIDHGVTWVIRHNQLIIATITLDDEQDPQYEFIRWAYPSNNVLVVHRLCVDPDFQQRGLAKQMMYFAEILAKQQGFEVIRLDAFLGNPYSQKLYPGLGYSEAAGYCYYSPGSIMCNCFEKWVSW